MYLRLVIEEFIGKGSIYKDRRCIDPACLVVCNSYLERQRKRPLSRPETRVLDKLVDSIC